MKKINKEKARTYALAVILSLLIVSVGLTVAYFSSSVTGNGQTDVTVNTENTPVLEFATSGSLSVAAGMYNFSEGDGNAVSEVVTSTATLTTDSAYTMEYFVYLNITENEFVYTQEDNSAELILTVYKDEVEVETISGLEYVTVGTVTGFDITEASGVYEIVNNYEISTTSSTPVTHTWTYKLTFINLDADQNDNAGKSLSAEIVMDDTEHQYPALYDEILKNEIDADGNNFDTVDAAKNYIATKTAVFSSTSTTNDGLYAITDDNGEASYYFRGAVDDNWVYFAGYYWRIIRIDGEGNIKMIYSGATAPTSSQSVVMNSSNTQISTSAFNSSSIYLNDGALLYKSTEGVGYVYTDNELHGTTTASTAKTAIDAWYTTNIENEGYDSYLATTMYCIDREAYSDESGTSSVTSVITTAHYYNAYVRLDTNKTPTLICANASDELSLKVGLISADEVSLAGGVYSSSNTSYYLYTGRNYWTLSPSYFSSNDALVFYVSSSGYLSGSLVISSFGLRPVVSLTSGALISGGSGTYLDPYTVAEQKAN